jgi:aromatic ring-opening dioxygenase LigB subunit
LGIGAGLLDEAGYAGPRALQAIGATESPQGCLRTGARVAELAPRVALLVVGDGSARCTPAAPGYFDERAAQFGRRVESALRDGDMAALAAIDASLAAELMATGRAAWQVLAGAVGAQRRVPGDVLYADAPFGVAYYVCVHPL